MLHAAVLEVRNEDEIELAEGILDPRVLLQPIQRGGMEVEDGIAVPLDLRFVRFAMEESEAATVPHRILDFESARGKGEQVGADRLRLGEGERRPAAPGLVRQECVFLKS